MATPLNLATSIGGIVALSIAAARKAKDLLSSQESSYNVKAHTETRVQLMRLLAHNLDLERDLPRLVDSELAKGKTTGYKQQLEDVKELWHHIARSKQIASKKKWITWRHIKELYEDDIKTLELLTKQLETLISFADSMKNERHKREYKSISCRLDSLDAHPALAQDSAQNVEDNNTASVPRIIKTAPVEPMEQLKRPSLSERLATAQIFKMLNRREYCYWQRHQQYSKERLEGTCTWIFDNLVYQQWHKDIQSSKSASGSILWVSGITGAGKSILVSSIVDDLQKSRSIVYFYFGKGKVQHASDVFGSLWAQIWCLTISSQPPNLLDFINDPEDIGRIQAWIKLSLEWFTENYRDRPVIVLDALDEENLEDFEKFKWFPRFLADHGFHMLVTSRKPQTDIPRVKLRINLPDGAQKADLKLFIKGLIDRSENEPAYELLKADNELFDLLMEKVKVQQSFAQIRLFMEALLRQTSPSQVQSMLDAGDPLTLFSYDYTARIGYVSQASVLWLLQRRRPLTVDALREVLALHRPCTEEHPFKTTAQQSSCASCYATRMATFPRRSHLPTVSFLQQCGKDLFRIDELSRTIALLFEDIVSQNVLTAGLDQFDSLGDMCVNYLSILELQDLRYTNFDEVEKYSKDHHFLCYAACSWQEHARKGDISRDMCERYTELLKSQDWLYRVLAIQAWDKHKERKNIRTLWQRELAEIQNTTALHIAIHCSDCTCLKNLIDSNDIVLQAASIRDLMIIAHDLEESECFDVLYQRHLDESLAFHEGGSRNALDQGFTDQEWAKVLATFDKRYGIAGYEEDCDKLSEVIRTENILALRSAWSRASSRRLKDLIGAFVLTKAIRNRQNDQEDQEDFVKTLLKMGMNPSPRLSGREKRDYSPLHAAAYVGSLNMVKSLLEYGANVSHVDRKQNTVLFPAIHSASRDDVPHETTLQMIRLFIEKGVDINAKGHMIDAPLKPRLTALAYAQQKHLDEIVQLLLQYGAEALSSGDPSPHSSRRSTANISTSSISDRSSEDMDSRLSRRKEIELMIQNDSSIGSMLLENQQITAEPESDSGLISQGSASSQASLQSPQSFPSFPASLSLSSSNSSTHTLIPARPQPAAPGPSSSQS